MACIQHGREVTTSTSTAGHVDASFQGSQRVCTTIVSDIGDQEKNITMEIFAELSDYATKYIRK